MHTCHCSHWEYLGQAICRRPSRSVGRSPSGKRVLHPFLRTFRHFLVFLSHILLVAEPFPGADEIQNGISTSCNIMSSVASQPACNMRLRGKWNMGKTVEF